ncbi:MAG: segregation/condensation protein A [Bacilli bacterium]|nr:segregation/condensation protein A [Bacilli bacterium]
MDYKIRIDNFDGPLDLLLHLIKESNMSIFDIKIEEITKQYLDYIISMEKLNLNIASEYLTMAAELIEMKSSMLLPKTKEEEQEEEDPKEKLINRLLEYQRYKEITRDFKNLEQLRKEYLTKEKSSLKDYVVEEKYDLEDIELSQLILAINNLLKRKEDEKPLHTKIARKEYSVKDRSNEIIHVLKEKKKVRFEELFEIFEKEYVIVTFLSILELANKKSIFIEQENNFEDIIIKIKGSE